ncbi:MAG: transposase [Clostridiales bacterium]|nr:transposase [Clostridiales bacterium]
MAVEVRRGTQAEDLTRTLIQLRKLIEELLEAGTADMLGAGAAMNGAARSMVLKDGWTSPYRRSGDSTAWVSPPLWAALRRRTEVLAHLVLEMYVRGLTTRDIEDALREWGGESVLSHASVSRLSERLREEYEAFCVPDGSGFAVVYLFADAICESLRQQAGLQQAILVTCATLRDGSKMLLHMSLGNKESERDWLEHFRSLVRRGLPTPLTVTTDGAPGLIKAVDAMWPEAERIRCWVHKMQNILDKVPGAVRPGLKAHRVAIRDAADHAQRQRLAEEVMAKYERSYPSAMEGLREDLAAGLAHLKLPPVRRRSSGTTNLVERSFEEKRRRLPRFRTGNA